MHGARCTVRSRGLICYGHGPLPSQIKHIQYRARAGPGQERAEAETSEVTANKVDKQTRNE